MTIGCVLAVSCGGGGRFRLGNDSLGSRKRCSCSGLGCPGRLLLRRAYCYYRRVGLKTGNGREVRHLLSSYRGRCGGSR